MITYIPKSALQALYFVRLLRTMDLVYEPTRCTGLTGAPTTITSITYNQLYRFWNRNDGVCVVIDAEHKMFWFAAEPTEVVGRFDVLFTGAMVGKRGQR